VSRRHPERAKEAKARSVTGHFVKRDAERLQRAVWAVAESESGREQGLHEGLSHQ
jgi:hypothetical protein